MLGDLFGRLLAGGRKMRATAPGSLGPSNPGRQRRTVLFIGIRGFTDWSEQQEPDTVVGLLNDWLGRAEGVWRKFGALKAKHAGGEIMLVFEDATSAFRAAEALRDEAEDRLSAHGLRACAGVHTGPVVEGMVGSREAKAYDVIGDSVDTAKLICDAARGGEILVSDAALGEAAPYALVDDPRPVHAKGKADFLRVFPLRGVIAPAEPASRRA